MIRSLVILSILLMSCVTVTPVADPVAICSQFEKCSDTLGNPLAGDDLNACMAVAEKQSILQDVAFADCSGLPPCAFSVCMQSHVRARSLAPRVTQGR